jgi:transcriptional regulator with XRE-family HTH domain
MNHSHSKELSDLELTTLTNIGRNVKFVRRDLLCLTLEEMAKQTSVSRDVICRLEALSTGDGSMGFGRIYPSISTVIKFSEGIGVTPSDLMGEDFTLNSKVQDSILEHCRDIAKLGSGMKTIESSDS